MNLGHQTESFGRAVAHAPPTRVEAHELNDLTHCTTSPFALNGWLEFNQLRWGVQPLRVRLSEGSSEVPAAHAVYYLDRKGRVSQPPANTYLPLEFESTPTQSRARLDGQWLAVGRLLAKDMKDRGIAGSVALPPEIEDIRPWQWMGFGATVRYRIHLDFPCSDSLLDLQAPGQNAQNSPAGFSQERVTDFADVAHCIQDTERRQGFRCGIALHDLELARELVGDDVLRAYVCYASNGEPASTRVILYRQGGRAIDWLIGTSDDYLRTGAADLLLSRVLTDLHAREATGFDCDRVHFPEVSSLQPPQGTRLVPYYVVESPSLLGLAKHVRDHWRYRRAG